MVGRATVAGDEIDRLCARVAQRADEPAGTDDLARQRARHAWEAARDALGMLAGGPLAAGLGRASRSFGLAEDARAVLAVLVAAELVPALRAALGAGADGASTASHIAALAFDAPDPTARWLRADAPLRGYALVDAIGDGPFDEVRVRAARDFWPRLIDPAWRPPDWTVLAPDRAWLAALALEAATRDAITAAAGLVARAAVTRDPLVIAVGDQAGTGRRAAALALAGAAGVAAIEVDRSAFASPAALASMRREACWYAAALVVAPGDGAVSPELLARVCGPILWLGADLDLEALAQRAAVYAVPVPQPGHGARVAIWRAAMPELPDAEVRRRAVPRHGPGRIHAIGALARVHARAGGARELSASVDAAARAIPDRRLGAIAERLEPTYARADLVLAAETARDLDVVLAAARHHADAAEAWHADGRGRLPGLVCMLAGAPGTGKTMAAQVLAREARTTLYRVDLARTVSKYIGETEKHLATLFDEASRCGAALFFDEADALFGARTKISDAHDRYANVETGYLLQRLEAHDGLSILATNLRENLDPAFLRRIQFVVELAAPGPAERQALWARYLPAPRAADIDLARLAARFALTGGDIRSTALTAELLARDAAAPVAMQHVVIAVALTLRKQGRLLTASDFAPWDGLVLRHFRKA